MENQTQVLMFGRYRGKTLNQVIELDPDYARRLVIRRQKLMTICPLPEQLRRLEKTITIKAEDRIARLENQIKTLLEESDIGR